MAEKSWARKGFDMLLEHFPDAEIDKVIYWGEPTYPWIVVRLVGHQGTYSIWRPTGAVYEEDLPERPAAVKDDPFLVPEGSPYLRTPS